MEAIRGWLGSTAPKNFDAEEKSFFRYLPDEILLHIFHQLKDGSAECQIMLVCFRWRHIGKKDIYAPKINQLQLYLNEVIQKIRSFISLEDFYLNPTHFSQEFKSNTGIEKNYLFFLDGNGRFWNNHEMCIQSNCKECRVVKLMMFFRESQTVFDEHVYKPFTFCLNVENFDPESSLSVKCDETSYTYDCLESIKIDFNKMATTSQFQKKVLYDLKKALSILSFKYQGPNGGLKGIVESGDYTDVVEDFTIVGTSNFSRESNYYL